MGEFWFCIVILVILASVVLVLLYDGMEKLRREFEEFKQSYYDLIDEIYESNR